MTKVALEAHAFRYLEARNDAPLDLLAGLPTVFCERISCKIRESLDTYRRCFARETPNTGTDRKPKIGAELRGTIAQMGNRTLLAETLVHESTVYVQSDICVNFRSK